MSLAEERLREGVCFEDGTDGAEEHDGNLNVVRHFERHMAPATEIDGSEVIAKKNFLQTGDELVGHALAWEDNPSGRDTQQSILKGQQFAWSQSNAEHDITSTTRQGV